MKYEAELSKYFDLKLKGRLGEAADCDHEVRVLNRIVRIDAEGVSYEADPPSRRNAHRCRRP